MKIQRIKKFICSIFHRKKITIFEEAKPSEKMKTLNFRTATVEELRILPHIGVKRAQQIIDRRSVKEERIKDQYEISNICRLGPKRMKDILDYIESNNIQLIF